MRNSVFLVLLGWTMGHPVMAQEDRIMIVPASERDQYWSVKKVQEPFYPRQAAENGVTGCAAVTFIIESDGRTSNRKILLSEPPDTFESPTLMALVGWRFKATRTNREKQPVYTYQVISYSLNDGETEGAPAETTNACSVAAQEKFAALMGGN